MRTMSTDRPPDDTEPGSVQLSFRLPAQLVAEIDARVEQLRKARDPGINRTIVVRELLKKGLES